MVSMAKLVTVEKGGYATAKLVKGGPMSFIQEGGEFINAQDLIPLGPTKKFEQTVDLIGEDDIYEASKVLLKVAEAYVEKCGAFYFAIDIIESGHRSRSHGTVREIEMFVQPYIMRVRQQ